MLSTVRWGLVNMLYIYAAYIAFTCATLSEPDSVFECTVVFVVLHCMLILELVVVC